MMQSKEARAIRHIVGAASLLKRGEPCPVTKLMPIQRLSLQSHGDQTYKCGQFGLFLLCRSHDLFLAGQSLSRVKLVPESEKEIFYNKAIDLVAPLAGQFKDEVEQKAHLVNLYHQIEYISPGWVRLYAHTSRRRLEDPDLVLIEQAIRCVLEGWQGGYWDYSLAQYFCCDYYHYRFIPTKESVDRFMDIADYLSQLHFDMDATAMLRAMEAPIDSGATTGEVH